jgi:hypothetical protein
MKTIEQMYNEAKALVEDRTYNIGEISEKTGLQKTANGWKTPKNNAENKKTEKEEKSKWEKTTDYQGRDRISLKTKQGGLVSIYETDNPNQKNNRFRVDTGTHTNTFNTLGEAKAFAEKHYGDTKSENPYALSKEEKNEAMKNPKTRVSQKYDEVIKSKKGTPQYNTALEEYTKEREFYKNSQGVEALKGFPVVPISKDSACRITADTKIKIKNVVEDRTYQIGEISEKTGLQKTANGWRPPKGNKGNSSPKQEENTFSNVVKEIGEKQFRKNLQEYEDGVDWSHMSLNEIEQELKNYNIDPLTFNYKTREGSKENKSASGKPSPYLVAKRLARAEARKAQSKTTASTKTATKLEWKPVKGEENMEIAEHSGNNIKLDKSFNGKYYWSVGTHSWYPTATGEAATREEAIKQATAASEKNPGVMTVEGMEFKRSPGGTYSTDNWVAFDNGNVMRISHDAYNKVYKFRVYEEGSDQQATFKTGEAKTREEAMKQAKKASDTHEHSGIRPIRIPYGAAFGNTTKWNNNDMYSSQPRKVKGSKNETKENESKFKITDLSPKLQKIVNETPELKSLLNKDTITIMKTNEGTILGEIDVKMAQKEGLKGKITTEPMSEYWAKELIEIYG